MFHNPRIGNQKPAESQIRKTCKAKFDKKKKSGERAHWTDPLRSNAFLPSKDRARQLGSSFSAIGLLGVLDVDIFRVPIPLEKGVAKTTNAKMESQVENWVPKIEYFEVNELTGFLAFSSPQESQESELWFSRSEHVRFHLHKQEMRENLLDEDSECLVLDHRRQRSPGQLRLRTMLSKKCPFLYTKARMMSERLVVEPGFDSSGRKVEVSGLGSHESTCACFKSNTPILLTKLTPFKSFQMTTIAVTHSDIIWSIRVRLHAWQHISMRNMLPTYANRRVLSGSWHSC
ncbi:hypothetical protein AAMO2058_000164100 [Amorphochlora amoebiformis]